MMEYLVTSLVSSNNERLKNVEALGKLSGDG